MSVNGEFGVNVSFQDREGSRIKVVQLSDNQRYTTGKVAIVTGTVGSNAITINPLSLPYKNAAGETVGISGIERIAFQANPVAFVDAAPSEQTGDNVNRSSNNRVNVIEVNNVTFVYTTAGTASYTLVLYGT